MTKYLSPLILQAILTKIDCEKSGLTHTDKSLLHSIIACISMENLSRDGYYSWPGIETFKSYTGLSEPTIKRLRKKLKDAGWIIVESGKGPGNSNKYKVNAQKLVDAYVECGFKRPKAPLAVIGKFTTKQTEQVKEEKDDEEDWPY